METGPSAASKGQRKCGSGLVDDATAARVDQEGLASRELAHQVRVNQMTGRVLAVVQRNVQGQHAAALHERVERGKGLLSSVVVAREQGIVDQDFASERAQQRGHAAADVTEAHDAHRTDPQIRIPGGRELVDGGEDVLGDRAGVAARGVRERDPAARERVQIDVVDARRRAAHEAKRTRVQQALVDAGHAAHEQGVRAAQVFRPDAVAGHELQFPRIRERLAQPEDGAIGHDAHRARLSEHARTVKGARNTAARERFA
jgi:hypothetical protein